VKEKRRTGGLYEGEESPNKSSKNEEKNLTPHRWGMISQEKKIRWGGEWVSTSERNAPKDGKDGGKKESE